MKLPRKIFKKNLSVVLCTYLLVSALGMIKQEESISNHCGVHSETLCRGLKRGEGGGGGGGRENRGQKEEDAQG